MSTLDKIRALVDARIGSPDPKIPVLKTTSASDPNKSSSFVTGTDFITRSTVVGTPTTITGDLSSATSGSGDNTGDTSTTSTGVDPDDKYGRRDRHDLTGGHFKGTFNRNYRGHS